MAVATDLGVIPYGYWTELDGKIAGVVRKAQRIRITGGSVQQAR